MYHEALWIAVSAAAPIIALGAILAFNDPGDKAHIYRQWLVDYRILRYRDEESSDSQYLFPFDTATGTTLTVGAAAVGSTDASTAVPAVADLPNTTAPRLTAGPMLTSIR